MALDKVQFMLPPGSNPLDFIGAVKAGNNIVIAADGTISTSSGVSKLVAGNNITLSPTTGIGEVTISASGGGGGGAVNSVSGSGSGISVSPTTGSVVVQNTGVTSLSAGKGISVSPTTGAATVSFTETIAASYEPIIWASGVTWNPCGGEGGSGGQSTSLGTMNFTVPDGVNSLAVWTRCRIIMNNNRDPADWPGSGPGVGNMRDWNLDISAGGWDRSGSGNLSGYCLALIVKNGRGNEVTVCRWDTGTVNGSGTRNLSINVTGSFGGLGSNCGGVQLPQIIVLPFQR